MDKTHGLILIGGQRAIVCIVTVSCHQNISRCAWAVGTNHYRRMLKDISAESQLHDITRGNFFDSAFMFAYSERPGTLASKVYPDDIPYEVKTARLNEIIALQGRMSLKSNEREIGRIHKVLVEGPSKKNPQELCGRAGSNKMCVFPSRGEKPGDCCEVRVVSVTSATLLCERID